MAEIRQMVEADLAAVAGIEELCFSQPWTKQGFLDGIAQKQNIFLVAVDEDGTIAGYIGMYVGGDEGEITNVATHPDARGCGYAINLLEGLKAECAQKEISRIILEVRVSNQPAISLYHKMGFEDVGIRKNFYSMPREDALIMIWENIEC